MTTQYTSILKLALPVQGELSGTWGDVVNDNITSMVEQAIAGRAVINSWSSNSHTLTTANGTTSEARCAMLEFTDTGTQLSGAGTVVCPALSKIYIAKNAAGQSVTLKTASGTGILVPNGRTMFLFCDGTNVIEAVTSTTSLQLGTSTTVTAVLDEDNMASNSATSLATQQSIKAYVDAQVGSFDTLAEVLAQGNTTGSTDIEVTSAQKVQFRDSAIYINSSADGQLDIVADTEIQIAATTINLKRGNGAVNGLSLSSGGDISFYEDTGTTAKFFWDASAESLGIGTSSPQSTVGRVDIAGVTTNFSTSPMITFRDTTGTTNSRNWSIGNVAINYGDFHIGCGDSNSDYFDAASHSKFMINKDGRVGIGTSSPAAKLDLGTSTGQKLLMYANNNIKYGMSIETSEYRMFAEDQATLTFGHLARTDGTTYTERMRLDSSGNLLVGTTDVDLGFTDGDSGFAVNTAGYIQAARDSANAILYLNKLNNDGTIIQMHKDGTTAGSIGTQGGDLNIGTGACGISFVDGVPALYPWSTTGNATRDAAIDLGDSGARFKDLYLSGATKLFSGTNSPSTNSTLGDVDFGARTDGTVTARMRGIAGNNGNGTDGQLTFYTADNTASQIAQERMRIDSSGNVGIGVSPSATLDIAGDNTYNRISSYFSGSYTSGFKFSDMNGGIWYDASTDDLTVSASHANSQLILESGGSERMRIDSSGNVGIGLDGGYKLDVLNTGGNVVSARFTSTATSSTEYGPLIVLSNDPNDTTRYLLAGGSSTVNRFVIYSNGNIKNQNNSYTGISDEKLKENIVDAGSQWDDIKALRVRKYSFKEENASEPTQIGVIAQEVEAAGMSGLVYETADQDTAEDGSFVKPGKVTKPLNSTFFSLKEVKAHKKEMIGFKK